MSSSNTEMLWYFLVLSEPLKTEVPLATCLTVGALHFQLLQDANVGDASILVSKTYTSSPPIKKLPGEDVLVTSLGYNHKKLVNCAGKPPGDFTQGSSMIKIAYSESTTSASYRGTLVNASGKSRISTYSQSPSSLRLPAQPRYNFQMTASTLCWRKLWLRLLVPELPLKAGSKSIKWPRAC